SPIRLKRPCWLPAEGLAHSSFIESRPIKSVLPTGPLAKWKGNGLQIRHPPVQIREGPFSLAPFPSVTCLRCLPFVDRHAGFARDHLQHPGTDCAVPGIESFRLGHRLLSSKATGPRSTRLSIGVLPGISPAPVERGGLSMSDPI